ncbi:MAG: DUF5916 domain-containing protein [Candidatus Neomarinimicrobiota bacterium]
MVAGTDGWSFLGENRNWAFIGQMAYSRVDGTRERISRLQQSPQHYYQRPDFETVSLDTNRTFLDGYMGRFGLHNIGGNWHFQTALGIISPGFDVNDLGYNSYGNLINMHVVAGYRWLEPTPWYRHISLYGMTSRNFDFDGNRLFAQYYHSGTFITLNYISVNWSIQLTPEGLDLFGTRGGPIIAYPAYAIGFLNASTDSRKAIMLNCGLAGQFMKDGTYWREFSISGVFRPTSSLRLTLATSFLDILDRRQWVANEEDPQATYGYHFVFADIDQDRVSATLRVDWGITPQLSLQAYFQPLLAVGDYTNFKELSRPKSYAFDPYHFDDSDDANPDFNSKYFKANVVLRWEYLPGSILYLVWTHDRTNYDRPGRFDFARDLQSLTKERGDNIFFVKASYMLSVY